MVEPFRNSAGGQDGVPLIGSVGAPPDVGGASWMATLLARADCMTWEATVVQTGDRLDWRFRVPPSGLYSRLIGGSPREDEMSLWWALEVVDQQEMDGRSRTALLSGAPYYEQEFRVKRAGAEFWLEERVSIEFLSPGRWHVVGVITDVTHRHRREDVFRLKEQQVQEILGQADCLLWRATVQRRGDVVAWSDFELADSRLYRRIFGDEAHRRGPILWSLVDVPELPEMDIRSRTAILGGAPGYSQEFRVVHANHTLWLREQVAIHPAGPDCWNLVGVLVDATVQREAENARLESETQVSQMLAGADCMLWQARVSENDAGTLDWTFFVPHSNLLRELFGDDPHAHRRLDWLPLVGVDACSAMARRADAAIRGGAPGYEQEIRAQREGRVFWLFERCSITRLGARDWRLVGVIVDNTARRVAEMALAAEKERLAVTLRAMADGVILTDTAGHVLFLNRAAAGLAECDVDEATGFAVDEVCVLQRESDGRAVRLPGVGDLSETAMVDLPPGTVLVGKHGTRRLLAGCCAAVRSSDGSPTGLVLVFRDITDRERLQREFTRASKLESIGILAGGIAHDFNNILTVILGNLNLALLDAVPVSEQEKALREAESGTLRARELTQQLLTFAKGGEPVRAAVRLPELLQEVTRFALHGSRVRAEFDLARDLWLADADKGQIGQVVQNLVMNAAQAMPEGGVVRIAGRNEHLTAARRGVEPGDYVHLVVSDTGVGIKPEHLSRIFDPYFTTKQQGSGLGLATVYSIITRHRGLIDVESRLGSGSSFHIWLPALPSAVPEAAVRATAMEPVARGAVLFMDDEEPILRMAGAIFTHLGVDAEFARDGGEAVERYLERRKTGRPFDVVIVDLTVPGGMGGLEAFERLRTIDPAVKVIVSSGYASDPVLANHRALGFAGMIAKPYALADFTRVVREVIQPARA